MAFFSRRGKQTPGRPGPDGEAHDAETPDDETTAAVGADSAAAGSAAPAAGAADSEPTTGSTDAASASTPEPEAVPHVGISMSTFGQPRAAASAPAAASGDPNATAAAPAPPARPAYVRPPAEAPAPTQSLPGLPDNVLVRAALAGLSEKPEPRAVMNVARQLLQGHLFVRVRGDARQLLADGKELTLAVSAIDDKRFLLAFTGGEALQASVRSDGDAQTSAMGQPSINVIRNVIAGSYAGLIIDHATPEGRVILPAQLLQKAIDEADLEFTIKNLLAAVRTPQTSAEIVAAMEKAPLWVAANVAADGKSMGVAESRSGDGARFLEVYSHPIEVAVLGRGDRAVAVTAAQLAKALAGDEALRGVIVDPAGPWIELSRADLAPLLALADGQTG